MSAFDSMADEPRWVSWRNEQRGDRLTKVPYGTGGRPAKADDPTTWATRDGAARIAKRIANGHGGGIGFQLGDLGAKLYMIGIDLDSCIETVDGQSVIADWARAIIEAVPTYAEVSPSGTGIKLFACVNTHDVRPFLDAIGVPAEGWGCRRSVPGNDGSNHGPAIEVYCARRYFAVTDNPLESSRDRPAVVYSTTLERLAKLVPPPRTNGTGSGGGATGDNSRSAKAFRLGADMRRAGRTFEEFVAALRADPETAEWCREKGEASDGRELKRIWDKAAAKEEEPDHVLELNKTFAVIRVVNRVAILNEHLDADQRPTFSLLSKDSFNLLLANRKATIASTDKNGNQTAVKVPLASCWISHPGRRQYEGIAFAPSGAPPGYYNLWNGFAIGPSERGSCERFKEHLLDNVCEDNSALFNWVFGWFADIFQNPASKCGTSLVLRGDMGVGKTIVGETFGHLLGLHYIQVADPRYVTGRFNAHLVRCLLFHCDEAFWAGDRAAEGKLKDLVTGKRHPIELKGFEAFFVHNYVRMFINGNPGWLVPAGMDERRFATLDVADTHKQDIPYFAKIANELENGGYAKLLYELLNFDLSTVDLRNIPKTAALLDQKISSLTAEDGWWLDILKSGRLPPRPNATGDRCPGRLLYEHYIDHAGKQGVRRRQIETAIGIFLRKSVPFLDSRVETFNVKAATPFDSATTDRGTVFTFPPLKDCRDSFAAKLQQTVEWNDPAEWQVV